MSLPKANVKKVTNELQRCKNWATRQWDATNSRLVILARQLLSLTIPFFSVKVISLLLKNRRIYFLGCGKLQHCVTYRREDINEGQGANVELVATRDCAAFGFESQDKETKQTKWNKTKQKTTTKKNSLRTFNQWSPTILLLHKSDKYICPECFVRDKSTSAEVDCS